MSERRPFDLTRNLRLLYAFGLARDFTPMLVVWVIYLTDFRDLSLSQVAVMEGLFWTVKLLLEIPSGAFADRFGRRTTFLTGLSLEATGTLVFALAGNFELLILSYVIWSAGLAFRSGNDGAYLFETLRAEGRDAEYGDRSGRYHALGTVSVLAGGLIGGVLAEVTTLQVAVLASVVPFCIALPIAFAMQEPPGRESPASRMTMAATLRTGLREVWRRRQVRFIVLFEVALTAVFPAFFLLAQPFLDHHGVPLALFGFLLIPVQLVSAAAGIMSGAAVRRFGLSAVLAAAMGASAAGLALIATVDHVVAFAGLALAMGGTGIVMPAIGAFINERTESHVRATVLSVAPLGTSLMLAVASSSAGLLAAGSLRVSFAAMAVAVAVLGGASLAAFLGAREAPEEAAAGEVIPVTVAGDS